jgi:hypothetical protein
MGLHGLLQGEPRSNTGPTVCGIPVRYHIKCKTYVKILDWIFNKCTEKLNSASFGGETKEKSVKSEG